MNKLSRRFGVPAIRLPADDSALKCIFAVLLAGLVLAVCACASPPPTAHDRWPPLGPARTIESGVVLHETVIKTTRGSSKVWIYLPVRPAQAKIPFVLIAPAGTRLFHGKSLGDGDRPEHLPYVRSGFGVVAYEIDGDPANKPNMIAAAQAFKDADAGVANAQEALDFALAQAPTLDPNRIYAAGHSSAATLALLVAENEPRVKACVAYAPVGDIVAYVGSMLDRLSASIPGFGKFMERSSPDRNLEKLKCPVFLFHADDDSVVPTTSVTRFEETARKTNPNVTLVRVEYGDHYDSMIKEGIPRAIEWLKGLTEKR